MEIIIFIACHSIARVLSQSGISLVCVVAVVDFLLRQSWFFLLLLENWIKQEMSMIFSYWIYLLMKQLQRTSHKHVSIMHCTYIEYAMKRNLRMYRAECVCVFAIATPSPYSMNEKRTLASKNRLWKKNKGGIHYSKRTILCIITRWGEFKQLVQFELKIGIPSHNRKKNNCQTKFRAPNLEHECVWRVNQINGNVYNC